MITAEEIGSRIMEMAAQIDRDYRDRDPLFLAVLNGAFMFTADLMKTVRIPCQVSFIKLASYSGTQSSGQVTELIGLNENIRGRHLIIVEDIIDTGITVAAILEAVKRYEPASVKVAALLLKPAALKENVSADYTCFEIGNDFVVGYGLDYDGYGRNLPHIYTEKKQ